jgi:Family of unknown function (DUF6350)
MPWLAGVLASAWALVAGLAISALPAVLVWLDEGAAAPVGDPVRIGVQIWLAGHRVELRIGDADIRFAPLGLTVVAVLLLYRAARWASRAADVETFRRASAVLLPGIGVYAVGGGALAIWSTTGQVAVHPAVASTCAGSVAAVALGLGILHEAALTDRLIAPLPADWLRVLRAAMIAVAGLLVVGCVLVAVSVVTRSDRIAAVAEALDPDVAGGLALGMAGVALVPNAIVWATVYALGPGFALGAGTAVSPGAVELGIVPAVPALAAVPADAPGLVGWLVLAGPVGVGVLAGLSLRRFSSSSRARQAVEAVAAAAAAAVVMAVLALLSGGAVGVARMSVVGPVPWQAALMTLVQVGFGAVVCVVIPARRPADVSETLVAGSNR